MRILLLLPPAFFSDPFHLGLGYISAVLKDTGHESVCWRVNNLSDLENQLSSYQPDLAGITATIVTYSLARECADRVKAILGQQVPVVIGGRHVSNLESGNADLVLAEPSFDYVIRGEGEYTILELVDTLERDGDLSKIKGLSWKRGGTHIHNPFRALEPNPDRFPYPDRLLLPQKDIVDTAGPVLSVRDCVHGCDCVHCKFEPIRARSVSNVLGELKAIEEQGYRFFHFADHDFLAQEARARDIAQAMIDARLELGWGCIAAPRYVKAETLEQLSASHCRTIMYFTNPYEIRQEEVLHTLALTREVNINTSLGVFDLRKETDIPPPSSFASLDLKRLVLGFRPEYTPYQEALRIKHHYQEALASVMVHLQDGYPLH